MRHPLITICDLRPLTDLELERLEATVRQILDTALDLTDAERATLIASLANIRTVLTLRQTVTVAIAP